jgi:hypothetical protein
MTPEIGSLLSSTTVTGTGSLVPSSITPVHVEGMTLTGDIVGWMLVIVVTADVDCEEGAGAAAGEVFFSAGREGAGRSL